MNHSYNNIFHSALQGYTSKSSSKGALNTVVGPSSIIFSSRAENALDIAQKMATNRSGQRGFIARQELVTSKRLKLELENEFTKLKEKNPGKSTISSFFSQPKTRNSHVDNDISPPDGTGLTQPDEDADYRLALLLSSHDFIPTSLQG